MSVAYTAPSLTSLRAPPGGTSACPIASKDLHPAAGLARSHAPAGRRSNIYSGTHSPARGFKITRLQARAPAPPRRRVARGRGTHVRASV